MNNLIDTHALIWFLNGDTELSTKAKEEIEKESAINFISIASLWEIAIKISLGKLQLSFSFADLAKIIQENGFQILPISFDDTMLISNLPFHHRDPFDRIIIAQGISNKLQVLTKDSNFNQYNIECVW